MVVTFSGRLLLKKKKGIISWEDGQLSIQEYQPLLTIRLHWQTDKHSKIITRLTHHCTVNAFLFSLSISGKKWGLSINNNNAEFVFCCAKEEILDEWISQLETSITTLKQWHTTSQYYEALGIGLAEAAEKDPSIKNFNDLASFCHNVTTREKCGYLSPSLLIAIQRASLSCASLIGMILERKDRSEIDYQECSVLGSGGFSVVRKGTLILSEGEIVVAVKQIDTNGHPETSPFELISLRRELLILKMVKHPNLLSYFGYVFQDPNYFIITELASCTLQKFISNPESNLSLPVKLRLIKDVCYGVLALHYCGIAHRDLKTENCLVFFDADNQPLVKLADFGISRVQDTGATQAVGTFNYMAPECMNSVNGQVSGVQILPTDIFSLAHVIYAVITGQEPHFGKTLTDIVLLTQSGSPLPIDKALWPSQLIPIVQQCWSVSPSARPTITQIVDIVDCLL